MSAHSYHMTHSGDDYGDNLDDIRNDESAWPRITEFGI